MSSTDFESPEEEISQVDEHNMVDSNNKALQSGEEYVPDAAAERALVRKIDLRLLPMLWVMVSRLPNLPGTFADMRAPPLSTCSIFSTVPTSEWVSRQL